MTFTEAAIEVLRREGKPLHFKKIAEVAIREGLLDHVGKVPEEIMGGQLAAHCRLPHADRRILAVQPATFALVEWGLDEDPSALDGMLERPAENEPPLRPKERHPIPSREIARSVGRGEPRVRRREEGEERRGRRYPPPAEVAYEILAGAERPMSLGELGAQGAERLLMPDAFVRDTVSLAAALQEDNRRRESAGRRPFFGIEGETVSLVGQPEPGERPAPPTPALRATAADVRRSALAVLRRRIRDCGGPTMEYLAARLLERMGLRDVKVAKRGREQVVFTGRKKIGLAEVRHCARVLRSGSDAGRREVQEVRRDLGHYGAQLGILFTPGDALREARGEALAAGQLPVFLLCGEALAEAFADANLGCQPLVVPEIDEAFFREATEVAEREDAVRRARREERERQGRERPPPIPVEPAPEAVEGTAPDALSATQLDDVEPPTPSYTPEPAGAPALAVADAAEEDDAEDGEEEAEVEAPGEASGAQQSEGEVRRRRRRRRRRGGRGRGRERGTAGAPGQPAAAAPGEAPSAPEAAPPPAASLPSVPEKEPSGDQGNAG